MHMQKLIRAKPILNTNSPKSFRMAHLAPNIRNSVYVGAGPRLSLD